MYCEPLLYGPGKAVGHGYPFDFIQRDQAVLLSALVRVLGPDAADHLVKDRAAGIQVGPGALAAA